MNAGAFKFREKLFAPAEIAEIALLAERRSDEKRGVHGAGKYADLRWFQVDLDPDAPFVRKLLKELNTETPDLLVFYYLEVGARLHPHRDLTGASLNNRLRFHVPIITNPQVVFHVSGEHIVMKPGDLWCLDTSYTHSVANLGDASRVHIVVECDINDAIRARIPNNLATKAHSLAYGAILLGAFVKAVARNAIADPRYFRAQMGMVRKFIGWRFLGNRRVD